MRLFFRDIYDAANCKISIDAPFWARQERLHNLNLLTADTTEKEWYHHEFPVAWERVKQTLVPIFKGTHKILVPIDEPNACILKGIVYFPARKASWLVTSNGFRSGYNHEYIDWQDPPVEARKLGIASADKIFGVRSGGGQNLLQIYPHNKADVKTGFACEWLNVQDFFPEFSELKA